jgi:hypothetical protein
MVLGATEKWDFGNDRTLVLHSWRARLVSNGSLQRALQVLLLQVAILSVLSFPDLVSSLKPLSSSISFQILVFSETNHSLFLCVSCGGKSIGWQGWSWLQQGVGNPIWAVVQPFLYLSLSANSHTLESNLFHFHVSSTTWGFQVSPGQRCVDAVAELECKLKLHYRWVLRIV